MNNTVKIFIWIAVALFPCFFFTPALSETHVTLAIPVFAALAYFICRLTKGKLSNRMNILALLSAWGFYFLIGAIYIALRGRGFPPIETLLVIEPAIIIGLIIGWGIYSLHSVWAKTVLGSLAACFVVFLFCGGEKMYTNRLYYGSCTGNISEPLGDFSLKLKDIEGQPTAFNVSGDKYSVIQIFHTGFGYSKLNVEKFMTPALVRYGNDVRVQFLVIGVPGAENYADVVSGRDIIATGLPYAECLNPEKTMDNLLYTKNDMEGLVIVKNNIIIFRGDIEMVNAKLVELLK